MSSQTGFHGLLEDSANPSTRSYCYLNHSVCFMSGIKEPKWELLSAKSCQSRPSVYFQLY